MCFCKFLEGAAKINTPQEECACDSISDGESVAVVSEENHGTRLKQTFQVFILTASAGWLRNFTLSAKTHLQRSLQNQPRVTFLSLTGARLQCNARIP